VRRWLQSQTAIELAEAILLSAVALMTAWSGYEAALWNSRSAADYGRASALGVSAQAAQTRSGQEMLYDAATFNQWLAAASSGNSQLAALLTRRFRPEYKTAFDAWLKTDPIHNPDAPASPAAMPQYNNASADKAAALARQAGEYFNSGGHDREVGDDYVRVTVVLAIVLFLIALSQRFEVRRIRFAMLGLALAVLAFAVYALATVPV
jgi:hypothetical protein